MFHFTDQNKKTTSFYFVFLTENFKKSAGQQCRLRILRYNYAGDIYGEQLTEKKTPSPGSQRLQHCLCQLSRIVCAYKSLTTRQYKKVQPINKLFQTSFYEHVICGRENYNEIVAYTVNHSKQQELDKLYSKE